MGNERNYTEQYAEFNVGTNVIGAGINPVTPRNYKLSVGNTEYVFPKKSDSESFVFTAQSNLDIGGKNSVFGVDFTEKLSPTIRLRPFENQKTSLDLKPYFSFGLEGMFVNHEVVRENLSDKAELASKNQEPQKDVDMAARTKAGVGFEAEIQHRNVETKPGKISATSTLGFETNFKRSGSAFEGDLTKYLPDYKNATFNFHPYWKGEAYFTKSGIGVTGKVGAEVPLNQGPVLAEHLPWYAELGMVIKLK